MLRMRLHGHSRIPRGPSRGLDRTVEGGPPVWWPRGRGTAPLTAKMKGTEEFHSTWCEDKDCVRFVFHAAGG